MAGPLNPSPNANNLVGALLKVYPPVGPTVDTGEPTAVTLTADGTVTINFPQTAAPITHGFFGLIITANSSATIGQITVGATNGPTSEVVGLIAPLGNAAAFMIVRPWYCSGFAGTDANLPNVTSLIATIPVSGTDASVSVKFAAVGSP